MGKIKKLKIALINPPLIGHKLRGTGTYTDELYKALKKENEVNVSLMDFSSVLSDVDIIHYPYFDPFFLTLPLINKRPTVVTVHDLIPLKFPEHFPKGIKGSLKWLRQKMSLNNADMIITDSHASQKDITAVTGIDLSRIKVIYLGVNESFRVIEDKKKLGRVKIKYRLPDDYILHVGDVNYNKNIPGLIKAFHETIQKHDNLYLVLVGNGFVNNSTQLTELAELINELKLSSRIIRIGYIPKEDLVGLYNQAVAYLQISYAEGFGLPVLEAMSCGCPVIVSNVSSLPEIVSDAGLFINPDSVKSMVEGLISMIANENLRKNFIDKGLIRAKFFSWKKCAQETVKVYRKVLS